MCRAVRDHRMNILVFGTHESLFEEPKDRQQGFRGIEAEDALINVHTVYIALE